MTQHLYNLALVVPWCITDEALEAMLAIAAGEDLDEAAVKQRFHGPKSLALRDGTRRDDSARMSMREGVALIPVDGPIYRYADMFTAMSGGVTTDQLAKDFQRALDDPAVRAVLFVFDSPGGEATGINELADAIYAARGQKPLGAYAEGYMASAAYWLASATGDIWVDDNALVGSIGTVMGVPDPAKRTSYRIDFVSKQSPKKRVDPTSEAGRAYLQAMVDDMTEVFVARVMRNRAMTREQVLAVEGGMLVGQKAVDAGLADRLGSEEQAIQDLLARAKPLDARSHFYAAFTQRSTV
jgi:ClpP class serine protease